MDADEVRKKIDNLIKEKKIPLAQISLGIGKNVAYIQQYIKKGSPVRLPEEQRKKLALILGVDEQELTDMPISSPIPAHLSGVSEVAGKIASLFIKKDEVIIEMIDATACCGDGVEALSEKVCGHWKLPTAEFNSITTGNPNNIKMLRVQGDSMQPTINDGDWVWVDISNNFISSDGMYLIRMATGLAVKRLQSGLSNIVIKSDNPTYSDITADIGEINIIGKVVYILNGRRV